MLIYNVTVMANAEDSNGVAKYIKEIMLPALLEDAAMKECRVQKLIAAPGMPDFADQAASIALQFDFADMDALHIWEGGRLEKALEALCDKFGNKVMTVPTILESEIVKL